MIFYAAFFLLKVSLYSFLISLIILVFSRLYFEPVKGVCNCKTNLDGKIALVTGGNSGLGLETARDLARRGARVIIACRNEKKAREAILDIAHTTGSTKVEFWYLDLFQPRCIREFAENFNRTFDRLDILVNNAGGIGSMPQVAENGVDFTMQVNYVGPFLLTSLLMDKLEASKPSRIVIVSSKLHYLAKLDINDLAGLRTQSHLQRYANSKLCDVLWARALATRLPDGITANSLHPGLVKTDIFNRLGYLGRIIEMSARILFKTPREGAQTIVHLCVAQELERSSGGYYSECKLRNFYKVAQDDELMEKVWVESVRLAEK